LRRVIVMTDSPVELLLPMKRLRETVKPQEAACAAS
jgi:hypothetical protein